VNGNQGAIGATNPYLYMHQRILLPYGADAIQLVYPNFYMTLTGAGEKALPPSMFSAATVTYSGGTSYAVGDIDTFATTNTTAIAPVKVMITAVSAGVPTSVQIIDGGLYNTELAAGVSPASTSGSGTGATATFTWAAGGMGAHIGIEPVWNTQVFSGQNSVELASKGYLADGLDNWNLLVPVGDFLVTDIIAIDVPVGGAIALRVGCGYNTIQAQRLPMTSTYSPTAPSANYERAAIGSTYFEVANTGTLNTSATSYLVQPIAILGIPKIQGPSVMAFGDSRCCMTATGTNALSGNFDPLDVDGNISWFEKALSQTVGIAFWPWSNMSIGGDKLAGAFPANSTLAGRQGRLKAIAMAQPTAVYVGLNVNDINAAVSLATVQAQEQQLIGELKGLGVKYVFTDTTDPWTTSSDSWATAGNQTTTSGSANITARNAALRAKTWATYDFFIDQSPNTESSVGSGKWASNGTANAVTGDGHHASPALITLKAAAAAAKMAASISI